MRERSGPPTPLPRAPDDPVEVARISANLPFVTRTVVGLAALGIGTNVFGVVVVALISQAMNTRARPGQLTAVLVAAVIATAVAVMLGVAAATLLQRRTLRWLLRGEQPSEEDARRAVRMPRDMAIISIVLWTAGALVVGLVGAIAGANATTVFGIVSGTVLAGLSAAGITYLLMGRVNQTVARLALAAAPPRTAPIFGVRYRLLFNWLLTSGVPLLGVVLVLSSPRDKTNVIGVSIVVAILAIALGLLSTVLLARSIGMPLRGVVTALGTVEQGDFDAHVEIEDSSEVGLVQVGFNEMVAGLRERERIQDLFGKHVGPTVAEHAIRGGITMQGEALDVVALFVDITGSTPLTRETEPVQFVEMLNRFFEVVVEEVEGNGGLLNKFEGDAALCVFGAPAHLDDPATAALLTARAIRDRVAAMGEFDVGIGVASGPVIAGQIGSPSRLEYTVIGDAVNEASRLTDLAKRVDGRILASEQTVDAACAEERELWVRGRALRLRGRDAITHSFRTVDGPRGAARPALPRRIGDVARAVADLPPLPRDH